jgi:pimeloyl-ACP methyl ester carboxylesterase
MAFLTVPNGRLYYEESGAGYPVLLFAPGFLSARIERWRSNPARPGVPQDWVDPIPVLSPHFRVIAFDVRNAGRSRVEIGERDGWHSYTEDHVALLRHLGIARCHVMGACIGVSFAFALAQALPGCVSALVLQNPIGLAGNRAAVQDEYDQWAAQVASDIPVLLMPGDDTMHPAEVSSDIQRLSRQAEIVAPWKGTQHREAAMARVLAFFQSHRPAEFGQ